MASLSCCFQMPTHAWRDENDLSGMTNSFPSFTQSSSCIRSPPGFSGSGTVAYDTTYPLPFPPARVWSTYIGGW